MNKIIFLFITILILFFSLQTKQKFLEVDFLDIGQGDAILIKTPTGQNILIDGGADNKVLAQVADNLPWWQRSIDYLVITHYHADHMMALPELINKYKIKNILVSSHAPDDLLYKILLDKLVNKDLHLSVVKAGDKFVISDNLYWQILLADDYHDDYNDNSVVVRLTYGETDFLFTGDLPISGEEKILSSSLQIESEVLKVGHHGSKYSSGSDFLEAVKPQLCIIQSGKDNKFGHPHQEALLRLEATGCWVKNTQNDGLIKVFSDSYKIYF